MDFINLPEAYLPSVRQGNERVGSVLKEVAKALGFPEDKNIAVSPGGGDNAMSALAAGAVREGVMILSLGTSGTLFGYSPRVVLDKTGVICPFCDATGGGLPLVCTLNCTQVPEDVRKATKTSREEITRLAGLEPAGSRGLNYIPFLSGERTPSGRAPCRR